MSPRKIHPDQAGIDTQLVRVLVAAQFPQWAALPLEPVDSGGLCNAIYRLGSDLSVRLSLWPAGTDVVRREQAKLAALAAFPACDHPFCRGDRLTYRRVPGRVVRPPLARRYAPLPGRAG